MTLLWYSNSRLISGDKVLFRVSQNNYFLLSMAQLSLFGSEKSLYEKGGNDLLCIITFCGSGES